VDIEREGSLLFELDDDGCNRWWADVMSTRLNSSERAVIARDLKRAYDANAEMLEAVRAMRDSVMNLAKRLDSEPGNQVAVAAWMHRIQAVDNAIARVDGRK
jgi:hypothetical protein